MATTHKYGEENWFGNPMGIPAHNLIENTYDVNQNLGQVDYKLDGVIVATLVLTYDVNNNLISVERTV